MSNQEYLQADEEVMSFFQNRTCTGPQVAVIVPMSKAQAYDQMNADRLQMKRVSVAAARVTLGMLCIGAMARDMMSPGLAVLAALACLAWAAAGYWRGTHG